MLKRLVLFVILLSTVLVFGCKSEPKSSAMTAKKQVIVSIYPVYDFAQEICGDKLDVSLLVTDKNIHDKEIGVADLKKIQSADAFLYNGGGMEPWVDKLLSGNDNKKLLVVNTGSGLFSGGKQIDPHIWLDITLATKQVERIADAVSQIDAINAGFYKQNAQNYIEKLNVLHSQYVELGKKHQGKDFVVMHPAFGYMANRYGFNQVSLVGLDEHSEPTPRDVVRVCNVIKDKKIKFIFIKSDVDDKVMKQIADTTGTKMLFLDSLESAANGSYLEVIRINLQNLQKAFEG